jgi:Leu/Phe-tRNA-protein transferase
MILMTVMLDFTSLDMPLDMGIFLINMIKGVMTWYLVYGETTLMLDQLHLNNSVLERQVRLLS